MLVAQTSRRRWWCTDTVWFHRLRIWIRPLSRTLFRNLPSAPAFWAAVTLMRPSGPASHHRRGRAWEAGEGCDHADGAPAACLVAGRNDLEALSEGARYGIVRRGRRAGSGCRHNAGPGTPMGRGFRSQGKASRGGSRSWVEQPPGDGSDFVEATESVVGMSAMNGSNRGKKPKVGVDLFR